MSHSYCYAPDGMKGNETITQTTNLQYPSISSSINQYQSNQSQLP